MSVTTGLCRTVSTLRTPSLLDDGASFVNRPEDTKPPHLDFGFPCRSAAHHDNRPSSLYHKTSHISRDLVTPRPTFAHVGQDRRGDIECPKQVRSILVLHQLRAMGSTKFISLRQHIPLADVPAFLEECGGRKSRVIHEHVHATPL